MAKHDDPSARPLQGRRLAAGIGRAAAAALAEARADIAVRWCIVIAGAEP